MALVTPEDLSDYMSGFRMNEAQRRSAAAILAGVQSELEDYLHRPLEPRRVREMVRVDRGGFLNVQHTPVSAVLRIQDYGSTLPSRPTNQVANYTPENTEKYPVSDYVPVNNGSEMIVPGGVRYGSPGQYVLIEYMAGGSRLIADRLASIKAAILRVASREMERMHDDTMSLRGGNAQEGRQSSALPTGWTDDELAQFDRLRRRIMA